MAPKPRPWFRFYVEATRDRKIRRLKPEHRWLWVVVLAVARSSPKPGWLIVGEGDPWTVEDLADEAALSVTQVRRGIEALLATDGLLVEEGEVWRVANWSARQFEADNSTERSRKRRANQGSSEQGCNVASTPDATPPETETETETEKTNPSPDEPGTELELVTEPGPPAVPARSEYTDAFEAFWKIYPRKTGKGAAARAHQKALRRPTVSAERIADAARTHGAEWASWPSQDHQYIPHPSTWLNEARYDDPPPPRRSQTGPATKADRNASILDASEQNMGVGR